MSSYQNIILDDHELQLVNHNKKIDDINTNINILNTNMTINDERYNQSIKHFKYINKKIDDHICIFKI